MEPHREQLCNYIDTLSEQIHAISSYLKENPEIAFEEVKACEYLSGQLESSGFHVKRGIADIQTAFLARPADCKPRRPLIALLAEYDALPKIGHGCGHNMIAAASIGAAIAIHQVMGDLAGGIAVVGTPAEEGSGGKALLAEAGVFKDMDAALMFHPGKLNIPGKDNLGRIKFKLEFFGRSSHASGSPDRGRNALDGLVLAYTGFQFMRQHLLPDGRIHGIITHGGDAPNIIPEHASGLFYVRAGNKEYLDELFDSINSCVKGAAQSTRTKAKVEIIHPRLDPINRNTPLENAVAHNMVRLGIDIDKDDGTRGSSDIGNLSHYLPAAHPYLAIVDPDDNIPGHSKGFREATTSIRGQKALINAAKVLALTAYDYLTSPELQTGIEDSFNSSK